MCMWPQILKVEGGKYQIQNLSMPVHMIWASDAKRGLDGVGNTLLTVMTKNAYENTFNLNNWKS